MRGQFDTFAVVRLLYGYCQTPVGYTASDRRSPCNLVQLRASSLFATFLVARRGEGQRRRRERTVEVSYEEGTVTTEDLKGAIEEADYTVAA